MTCGRFCIMCQHCQACQAVSTLVDIFSSFRFRPTLRHSDAHTHTLLGASQAHFALVCTAHTEDRRRCAYLSRPRYVRLYGNGAALLSPSLPYPSPTLPRSSVSIVLASRISTPRTCVAAAQLFACSWHDNEPSRIGRWAGSTNGQGWCMAWDVGRDLYLIMMVFRTLDHPRCTHDAHGCCG